MEAVDRSDVYEQQDASYVPFANPAGIRRARPSASLRVGPTRRRGRSEYPRMLNGKRIVVVMPAYNASPTLRETYTCPATYFNEASSTGAWRSTVYGLGGVRTTCRELLARAGVRHDPWFDPNGNKRRDDAPEYGPCPSPSTKCT